MALETPAVEAHNEVEAIVGGYHGDAFRILGPHALPDGKDGDGTMGGPRVLAACLIC